MSYIVTHATIPAAVDLGFPDAKSALDHASRLISEGHENVAIQDGNGRYISGDDLIACCNGDKKLTADLRAVD